jgi:hypothetical protein
VAGDAVAPERVVTQSLYGMRKSSRGRDERSLIVVFVDVVAIAIGITMFAILLLLIEGIDRV